MPEIRFLAPAAAVVTGIVLACDPSCVRPSHVLVLYMLFVARAITCR
jgi:hypothetical protein